jgi:hypothetical protein
LVLQVSDGKQESEHLKSDTEKSKEAVMNSTTAEHILSPSSANLAKGERTSSACTADKLPVDTVDTSNVRTGARADGVTSLSQSVPLNKEIGTGSRLGLQVEVDKHSDDEGSCKERLKIDDMSHVWDDDEGDDEEDDTETEEEGDEEETEEEGDTQEGQYYEELQEEEEEDAVAESRNKTYYKGECSESDSNSELNSVSNEEKRSEAGVQDSPHLR